MQRAQVPPQQQSVYVPTNNVYSLLELDDDKEEGEEKQEKEEKTNAVTLLYSSIPNQSSHMNIESSFTPTLSSSTSTYQPPWRFERPFTTDYVLEEGNECPYYLTPASSDSTPPPLESSFYGYCYLCGYSRHSQMYCPLRFCTTCKQYGHSSKVCHHHHQSNKPL
jgi:hypothetical protein